MEVAYARGAARGGEGLNRPSCRRSYNISRSQCRSPGKWSYLSSTEARRNSFRTLHRRIDFRVSVPLFPLAKPISLHSSRRWLAPARSLPFLFRLRPDRSALSRGKATATEGRESYFVAEVVGRKFANDGRGGK